VGEGVGAAFVVADRSTIARWSSASRRRTAVYGVTVMVPNWVGSNVTRRPPTRACLASKRGRRQDAPPGRGAMTMTGQCPRGALSGSDEAEMFQVAVPPTFARFSGGPS